MNNDIQEISKLRSQLKKHAALTLLVLGLGIGFWLLSWCIR